MAMDDDQDDVRNTSLSLMLNYDGKSSTDLSIGGDRRPRPNSGLKLERSSSTAASLTLGLPGIGYASAMAQIELGRRSSPPDHSMISSSFSGGGYDHPSKIKRENDARSDEAEKVSSRISDEEEDGTARKKLRLSKEQSAFLEDKFKEHSTLDPKQKQALAKQLNLRPRQVEVWFQNRRARTKLKKTEVELEFLRRCCETLTEENRRLQKEVQELKSHKFSAPIKHVQLPAAAGAAFTMCPSCKKVVVSAAAAAASDGGAEGGSLVAAPKPHHFFNPFAHSAAC